MAKVKKPYFVGSSASVQPCRGQPNQAPQLDKTNPHLPDQGSSATMPKRPKTLKLPLKSASKKAVSTHSVAKKKKASKSTLRLNKSPGDPKDKICAGLAKWESIGIHEMSRLHAASFANYKHIMSRGFVDAMKELKDNGLIEYPNAKTVRLTDKGRRETPAVDPPKSNAEALLELQKVIHTVCANSGPKSDLICQFLSNGKEYSVEAVLRASGYKHLQSKGFVDVLATLSMVGLLERNHGTVKLSDIAFPYGRPNESVKCTL
jgi:hypothetical protein